MGYTDPQSVNNPTAGATLPAAWGDIVRDDLEWLGRNKPHCRVYNNAAISVANTTLTALTFNSERVDVGAMHSTVSNTSRITVPTGGDGWYSIGGNIQWAANATGIRVLIIRLNGATNICNNRTLTLGGSDVTEQTLHTYYQLAAGDYVELCGYQSSGGALNASASGNSAPEMWASWEAI